MKTNNGEFSVYKKISDNFETNRPLPSSKEVNTLPVNRDIDLHSIPTTYNQHSSLNPPLGQELTQPAPSFFLSEASYTPNASRHKTNYVKLHLPSDHIISLYSQELIHIKLSDKIDLVFILLSRVDRSSHFLNLNPYISSFNTPSCVTQPSEVYQKRSARELTSPNTVSCHGKHSVGTIETGVKPYEIQTIYIRSLPHTGHRCFLTIPSSSAAFFMLLGAPCPMSAVKLILKLFAPAEGATQNSKPKTNNVTLNTPNLLTSCSRRQTHKEEITL